MSGYTEVEQAALMLRDQTPIDVLVHSPAQGCCGCGAWLADIRTFPSDGYPHGEGYCWGCVDRIGIADGSYVVLEGRDR